MKVFISHSFGDDARFDDLCLALEKEGLEYWNPKEMRGGASLREQLRKAIQECELCVFLATHKSVDSNWCLAELGAFWGSQKKVIIYVADETLTDDDLPQQFKGDIWQRKLRDVVREVKQTLAEAEGNQRERTQKEDSAARVGDISVGTLLDLLRNILRQPGQNPPFSETMDRLASLISSKTKAAGDVEISPDFSAALKPYLTLLMGEPIESLKSLGKGTWKSGFTIETSTGSWTGYSCIEATYAGGDVEIHTGCLIIHLRGGFVDACAVVAQVGEIGVNSPTEYRFQDVIAQEGQTLPGSITSFTGFFRVVDNSQ
jgi:hypothetical protein